MAADFCSRLFWGEVSELKDVRDIGMGNSVYWLHVVFSNGRMGEFVLKDKSVRSQVFYADLLDALGWPCFKTTIVNLESGDWELSQYVLGQNLNAYITSHVDMTRWIPSLAARAALGDLIGQGDRHVENYVCSGQELVAVDVSYMFWPDNEEWTYRYIAGGVYEINALKRFQLDSALLSVRLQEFWTVYASTFKWLSAQGERLSELISLHFPDSDSPQRFVNSRLQRGSDFIQSQKHRCTDAFLESLRRDRYKLALVQLANECPDLLQDYPWLKMYYLADRDRPSAFFCMRNLICRTCFLLSKKKPVIFWE